MSYFLGEYTKAAKLVLEELKKAEPPKKNMFYGNENRKTFLFKKLSDEIKKLSQASWDLFVLVKEDSSLEEQVREIRKQVQQIESACQKQDYVRVSLGIEILEGATKKLEPKTSFSFTIPSLPLVIKSEMAADFEELEKCFRHGCFRSTVILCGRILETALFRKYYELKNVDLMETSPNLGLGKIIAKLREEKVEFDPGTNEQIHLINQMRISSVHAKKEQFTPTREQTHAIILYTVDVLRKLFGSK